MSKLYMNITYNIETDEYKIETNVKPERQRDIIQEYIRSQMGQGTDDGEPNEGFVFHIGLELELATDTFKVSDDTGNKGLRDGILMTIAEKLKDSA